MRREEIINFLGEDWNRVSEFMASALSSDIELLDITNRSLLSNTGKQLRPMLTLLMARLCGKVTDDTIRFAAASEMLHNATLMHDDVADESSTRRGRPTLVSAMGPAAAVLVGDFWLSRTVQAVLGAERHERVVNLFSKTLSDLAEGEMLQMQKASSCDTDEKDYLRIIYCKTASLFVSACESGAVSVDASEECTAAAVKFATALGTAFQIRDDIFDYSSRDEIGKPVGIDLREQKITLPLLGAIAESEDPESLRTLVKEIPDHPENCGLLHDAVLASGGMEYAVKRLREFTDEAVEALSIFPDCEEKRFLVALAEYNATRCV